MIISLLFIILMDASRVSTYRNFFTLMNNLESTYEHDNICSTEDSDSNMSTTTRKPIPKDPLCVLDDYVNNFMFDGSIAIDGRMSYCRYQGGGKSDSGIYPTGNINRAEYFGNYSAVHMPDLEHIFTGSSHLRLTEDLMQTAVDVFFIIVHGDVSDVLRLPSDYVLESANTLSMMKISHEKLTALWTVVKNGRNTEDISAQTLEMYRPLFKYVNAREMARLNLSDPRILMYLGTHPDLTRHQVGVIAGKFVALNPGWHQSGRLNLMNNLLCGLPIALIRKIQDETLLQLSHSAFYHIYACEPLQLRFFFQLMTKPQVLGKAYSWSFEEVFKLGLLLIEARGNQLTTIRPYAISAITPQVMVKMKPANLIYLTDQQKASLKPNVFNILKKKLRSYSNIRRGINTANTQQHELFTLLLLHTSITVLINFCK